VDFPHWGTDRSDPKYGFGPQKSIPAFEEKNMKNMILKSVSRLHQDEAGQGLVEYALILALVAFAAVVAMQTLAKDINNAFVGIGTILSSYVP
jgi:pilus assembly protein Flp/PilA